MCDRFPQTQEQAKNATLLVNTVVEVLARAIRRACACARARTHTHTHTQRTEIKGIQIGKK